MGWLGGLSLGAPYWMGSLGCVYSVFSGCLRGWSLPRACWLARWFTLFGSGARSGQVGMLLHALSLCYSCGSLTSRGPLAGLLALLWLVGTLGGSLHLMGALARSLPLSWSFFSIRLHPLFNLDTVTLFDTTLTTIKLFLRLFSRCEFDIFIHLLSLPLTLESLLLPFH